MSIVSPIIWHSKKKMHLDKKRKHLETHATQESIRQILQTNALETHGGVNECIERLLSTPWVPSPEHPLCNDRLRAIPLRSTEEIIEMRRERMANLTADEVQALTETELEKWFEVNAVAKPAVRGRQALITRVRTHLMLESPKKTLHWQRPCRRRPGKRAATSIVAKMGARRIAVQGKAFSMRVKKPSGLQSTQALGMRMCKLLHDTNADAKVDDEKDKHEDDKEGAPALKLFSMFEYLDESSDDNEDEDDVGLMALLVDDEESKEAEEQVGTEHEGEAEIPAFNLTEFIDSDSSSEETEDNEELSTVSTDE